mgnify:CR=1 FL=1
MKWLKRLFSKEETIYWQDVNRWINDNLKTYRKETEEEVKELNIEMEELKSSLNKHLDELEAAEVEGLHRYPKKAIDAMTGNKDLYLRSMRKLLSEIKFSGELDEATEQARNYQEKLNETAEKTTKAFYVLSEFFRNECQNVAEDVKKIAKNLEKRTNKGNYAKFRELKELYDDYLQTLDAKKEHKSQIQEINSEKKEVQEKYNNLKREIQELKKSDEMKQYNKLKSDLEKTENSLALIRSEYYNKFAIIEKALKKFQYIATEHDIINSYLQDPVGGLLDDKSFKICPELQKLSGLLEEGKLDIKGKKKDKTIEMLKNFNKDTLSHYKSKITELQEEVKKKKDELDKFTILEKIAELESRQRQIKRDIEHKENQKTRVTQKAETDPQPIIQKIKDKAREMNVIINE